MLLFDLPAEILLVILKFNKNDLLNLRLVNSYFSIIIPKIVNLIKVDKKNVVVSYYDKKENRNHLYNLKKFIKTFNFRYYYKINVEVIPFSCKCTLFSEQHGKSLKLNDEHKLFKLSSKYDVGFSVDFLSKCELIIKNVKTGWINVKCDDLKLINVKCISLEIKCSQFDFINCDIQKELIINFVKPFNINWFLQQLNLIDNKELTNELLKFTNCENLIIAPQKHIAKYCVYFIEPFVQFYNKDCLLVIQRKYKNVERFTN